VALREVSLASVQPGAERAACRDLASLPVPGSAPTRAPALALGFGVALAALGPGGCGAGHGAPQWLPAEVAAARCNLGGPQGFTPILAAVPGVEVPASFFGRQLDPQALDALGFVRDEPACAVLVTPPEAAADGIRAAVPSLLEAHAAFDLAAAGAFGVCTCEVAAAAGHRDLVRRCTALPRNHACTVEPGQPERLVELRAPLDEQLAAMPLPVLHWRLAGRTDRPGWFLEHIDTLLAEYPGGSFVTRAGQATPLEPRFEATRVLRDAPGVVAVVQQGLDDAYLVARELDGALILDLFILPPVRSDLRGLRLELVRQRADELVALLAAPAAEQRFTPAIDPRRSNVMMLDAAALERVDQLLIAFTSFDRPFIPEQPPTAPELSETAAQLLPSAPPRFVDRAWVHAPLSADDRELRARFELSEAGVQWAAGIPHEFLDPTGELLSLPSEELRTPRRPNEPQYVLRGTAAEAAWVHGLVLFPRLMVAAERSSPSTIQGRADEPVFELPTGPLTPELASRPPPAWQRMLERIAAAPHRVTTRFDPARTVLDVELKPR
jgi:hypothetical protein